MDSNTPPPAEDPANRPAGANTPVSDEGGAAPSPPNLEAGKGVEEAAAPGDSKAPPASSYRTPLQPSHFIVLGIILAALYQCTLREIPRQKMSSARAKAARAKSDMRSLATGLETYFVDFNAYPTGQSLPHAAQAAGQSPLKLFKALRAADRLQLKAINTSGTRLLGADAKVLMDQVLYADPFAKVSGTTFVYHSDPKGWILVSAGPDQDYDILPSRDYDGATTQPTAQLLMLTYNPTNGTVSDGDIWRVRQ